MSIDGPFGSKTSVFTINRSPHKRSTSALQQSKLTPVSPGASSSTSGDVSGLTNIIVNPQACPAIMKQILEIMSTLARAANFNFFPRHPTTKQPQPPQTPTSATPTTAQQQPQQPSKSHFWDIVVKLDQSKNKSSKLSGKSSAAAQPASSEASHPMSELINDSDMDVSVDNSPLARLMSMLDYPVLRHNAALMDKMFTCLSYASAGIATQIDPAAAAAAAAKAATTTEAANNEPLLNKQIELVVNVLKNKLCTQDGLQQAYTLLNNLSKINSATRHMIIQHLLRGVRELGLAVCREIDMLMDEAVKYNQSVAAAAAEAAAVAAAAAAAASSDESAAPVASESGSLMASYAQQQPSTSRSASSMATTAQHAAHQNLIDSYSNLVISSPKSKQSRELQLPSMSLLVEKNSNQKFFVRLIRLIINLRETIEKEAKKRKAAAAAAATAAAAASAAASTAATASAVPTATTTTVVAPETTTVAGGEQAVAAEQTAATTVTTVVEMDDTTTPKADQADAAPTVSHEILRIFTVFWCVKNN